MDELAEFGLMVGWYGGLAPPTKGADLPDSYLLLTKPGYR